MQPITRTHDAGLGDRDVYEAVPIQDQNTPIPDWILHNPTLSARALRVWIYLMRHNHRTDGAGSLSRRQLADLCYCSVHSVDRAVRELRGIGAVTSDPYEPEDNGGSYQSMPSYEAPREHHRTRARRYGTTYEPISPVRVYDRDGWVCGLCHQAVDRALHWSDPMSVSIDHIVPLSRGGGHVWGNVQCAHRQCNVQKGNRI